MEGRYGNNHLRGVSHPLTGIFGGLLLGSALVQSAHSVLALDGLLEKFKGFVSNPPPIKELILYQSSPGRTETNVFRFRLQNNAILGQEFKSVADYRTWLKGERESTGDVAGRYENYYWVIRNQTFYEWYRNKEKSLGTEWERAETSDFEYKEPGETIAWMTRSALSGWLNLGLKSLPPGAIEWDGNGVVVTNESGVLHDAKLIVEDGWPHALKGVMKGRATNDFAHTFEYFGKNTPIYLPGVVNYAARYGGEGGPIDQFIVQELTLADSSLPKRMFMPKAFLHKGLAKHVEYTGISTNEEAFVVYRQRQWRRSWLWMAPASGVVVISGGGALMWFLRSRWRESVK